MHVGEHATGAGEGNGDNHEDFENNARSFVFDVMRENDGNHEENGGNHHNVRRREGGFAGAIRARGKNDKFVKNDISDSHEDNWYSHPGDFGVDFGKILAFDPLVEPKAKKGHKS